MDEQLINDRLRLDNINSEMTRISNVAREYMNASQEQRDRVNPQLLASVLDRYNTLKADRLALEQSIVAREMEAQRQAVQPAQQQYNSWGRRRTIIPTQQYEEVIVEQPINPQQPQMNLYNQQRINELIRQGRAYNTANVLSNQNLTAWNTIISNNGGYPGGANVVNGITNPTPGASIGRYNTGSAVAQRNSLPWYRQLVTPYSNDYLREVGAL